MQTIDCKNIFITRHCISRSKFYDYIKNVRLVLKKKKKKGERCSVVRRHHLITILLLIIINILLSPKHV